MENDPILANQYLSPFPALTDTLLLAMDCPDFTLEKPDKNLLDKFIDIFDRDDSAVIANKEQKKAKRAQRETAKKKEKEGFFKRVGKFFKKKK